jgi:hypothetical protein
MQRDLAFRPKQLVKTIGTFITSQLNGYESAVRLQAGSAAVLGKQAEHSPGRLLFACLAKSMMPQLVYCKGCTIDHWPVISRVVCIGPPFAVLIPH